MIQKILGKNVNVSASTNLYKWAKVWGKIQKNYYNDQVYLRREKQIEDFIALNEFKNIYIEKDTDILSKIDSVGSAANADLVVITDQKFSRLPCQAIIEQIEKLLDDCPRIFLCLNRHYINIDSSFVDTSVSDHYPLAITQWLKKNILGAKVLDLSLDYLDSGDWFTWVVPDRMYFIERV